MNDAAIAGSDDANGDSGHGSDVDWEGQGTVEEAGGGRRTGNSADGGSASLHW